MLLLLLLTLPTLFVFEVLLKRMMLSSPCSCLFDGGWGDAMAFNGDYGGSGFCAKKSLYYSDCFGFLRSVNIFVELLLYLYLICYCYADGEKNFLL